VENYFNYFTEIEEHFQRRRGGILLLSTLDWALIETWKDAGIPLEAVLRGIDGAFDKYERRASKTQKINGLAWCAQAVLTAAEEMKEAAVGASRPEGRSETAKGFETSEIVAFLRRNAEQLDAAKLPAAKSPPPVRSAIASTISSTPTSPTTSRAASPRQLGKTMWPFTNG